ncbi:MAG: NosD domain-containing protein, partial [Candidatus Heimdallarchaeaceae archaeon]
CESNNHGILLTDSKYNEIISNVLLRNVRYGVRINTLLSSGNIIHSNYFICNNLNGTEDGNSQAYDESFSNWYDEDTNTGNYYSDYSGESEYQIDGRNNKTDPYPMVYNFDCYGTEKTSGQSTLITLIVLVTFAGTLVTCRKPSSKTCY